MPRDYDSFLDLIISLRGLANHEHDDHSVAAEAAKILEIIADVIAPVFWGDDGDEEVKNDD